MGIVKVSVSAGTHGRAETSNMPRTHRGLLDFNSARGWAIIAEQPDSMGEITP